MAELGSHLTQTAQIKPSIFDYIAQERLNDIARPSMKKLVELLANRYPMFNIFFKFFDECFFIEYFFIQMYYLQEYSATFSEKFYGLQRVPVKSLNKSLGKKEFLSSLMSVVLFPYLKLKLGNASEKLQYNIEPSNSKSFLKNLVIWCNSGINISHQVIKLVLILRYLCGKTDIVTPSLWTSGVKLVYSNAQHDAEINVRNTIQQMLQKSMEIGAFFIQFLQYWQLEKSNSFQILPVPPPPQKRKEGIQCENKCPICMKQITVETVLPTSGFVFCFKCITSYLEKFNSCPITKLPASIQNIIRIYQP